MARFLQAAPAVNRIIALGLVLVPLTACVAETDSEAAGSDIIGGVEASSAKLDAIGSLGTKNSGGEFEFFCTATLIGPKAVLTAKHCATADPTEEPRLAYEKVFFAVGADSKAPKQVVEAVDVLLAPLGEGGFVKFGSDVAVYILAEPMADVEPMPYLDAHLKVEEVGKKFTAVGYGVRDTDRSSGERRAGTLTLQAVEGQPIHVLFPTKEALIAHMAQYETPEWIESNQDRLTEFYDFTLLPGHEAYAGMGPYDAQPCTGDSGGPLVANLDGKLTVVAVVSGSFKGRTYPCSTAGEAYATLGESAQPMIKSAVGPCEGVPVAGRCKGAVAERCVAEYEGPQKITRTDCALLNQTCSMVEERVACVDPS
jgi:secreted trypsin-like serine protease